MSVETITIIITAATLVVTIVGGLFGVSAWILRQMDERFAQSDARVDARFDKVDVRFEKVDAQFEKVDERFTQADASVNARFNTVDEQFKEMGTQMSGLRAELNDVKVAVARLEGPHQRLILPPHSSGA